MKRHYYVTNDWEDLEIASTELSRQGIHASHQRVLTGYIAGAKAHHLQPVNELKRRDVFLHRCARRFLRRVAGRCSAHAGSTYGLGGANGLGAFHLAEHRAVCVQHLGRAG